MPYLYSRLLHNYLYSSSKRATIGHNVWIGNYIFIKAGVCVGTGAIIGAHSVVTNNVKPCIIVAGNPAVMIKK